jgi:hypothetical protein
MRSQDETLADAVGRPYGEAMVIQNQLHRGDMTKDEAVMARQAPRLEQHQFTSHVDSGTHLHGQGRADPR